MDSGLVPVSVRPTGQAFPARSEGWTSTSTPSLEEPLDDHQPTRTWENGEGHG